MINIDYYVEVSLVAKDNYKFRDNDHITLKVNGKDTDFEMNQYNADGAQYYMFYAKIKAAPVLETIPISAITSNVATTNTITNPQTGDNVMFYIFILGLSVISFAGIYTKKRKFK